MNAVAPPNHRSVLVLTRLLANHISQFGNIFQQDITRPNKLYRKRSIQYIRRGKTLMHPSRLRSNVGGDIFKECNHVVIGPLFDLENFRNRKLPSITNSLRIRLRNQPKLSHGFTRQRLNFQPNRKLVLIAPNLQHPGSGIPSNHGMTLRPGQELQRTYLTSLWIKLKSPNPGSNLTTVIHEAYLPRSEKIGHCRNGFLL